MIKLLPGQERQRKICLDFFEASEVYETHHIRLYVDCHYVVLALLGLATLTLVTFTITTSHYSLTASTTSFFTTIHHAFRTYNTASQPTVPILKIPVRKVRVDPHNPHPAAGQNREAKNADKIRNRGAFYSEIFRLVNSLLPLVRRRWRTSSTSSIASASISDDASNHVHPMDAGLESSSSSTGGANASTNSSTDLSSSSTGGTSPTNNTFPANSSSSSSSSSSTGTALTPSTWDVDGRVHLLDYSDFMFIGVIGVGTPAQYFGCVFDTGSADTWIFSDQFPNDEKLGRRSWIHYFNESASSTYQFVQSSGWSISYGKGAASGGISQDNLWLGGMDLGERYLALVTSTAGALDVFIQPEEPIDGIFGLGFSELATDARLAAMPTAGPNRTPAVFSFHMASGGTSSPETFPDDTIPREGINQISSEDAVDHPQSWFQLGARDSSLAPHGFTDLPIYDFQGRWIVKLDAMSVGGSDVSNLCQSKTCTVMVDSGSSFIIMPSSQFVTVMNTIIAERPDCSIEGTCGENEVRVVCTFTDSYEFFPTVSLRFNERNFYLQPEEYIVIEAQKDEQGTDVNILQLGFTCGPSSISGSMGSQYEVWILGDTFLKNYYTVFDMPQKVIAFANKVPDYEFTWKTVVLIGSLTLGVMGGIFIYLHYRYIYVRPPPSAAADGPSGGRVGAILNRIPRGYAHVGIEDASGDQVDEESRHHPSSPSSASNSNRPRLNENVELTNMAFSSAVGPPTTSDSANLIPSQLARTSSDDFDVSDLQEL